MSQCPIKFGRTEILPFLMKEKKNLASLFSRIIFFPNHFFGKKKIKIWRKSKLAQIKKGKGKQKNKKRRKKKRSKKES